MKRIGNWSSGADDARVENTNTVMLGVETNDNTDDEKRHHNVIQCMRSWWKIVEVVQIIPHNTSLSKC